DPAARYPSGEAFAAAVAAALDRRTAVAVRAFVTEARQLSTATVLYGAFASIAFPLTVLRFIEVRELEPRAAAFAMGVAIVAGPIVRLVWGAATLVALFAAVVARGRTEHRTDPKGERRLRFWSGPPGRWLFALARLRLPPLTPPPGARGA